MLDRRPEVARLRDRVEELEAENARLRAVLAPPTFAPPAAWGLTRRERELTAVFAARPPETVLPLERLKVALYGPDADVDPKSLDIWILKLRRKLAAAGIEIRTMHGLGRFVPRESHERLRQACLPEAA